MSSVLMVLLALAAPPAAESENQPAAAASESRVPLIGRELERAAHEALRRWAKPDDSVADSAAREFLDLYRDLAADTKLAASTRDQLRGKVRGRLMQISEQIVKRIAKEKRLAKNKTPGTLKTPDDKDEALAQVGRPQAGGGGQGFGGAGMGTGFGGGFNPGGVGGNAEMDNGQALVDLIQKTIAPSTWDVNGGNGSIYYWSPLKVLVVRQTDEVHGQLSDTLDQLQRANR